MTNKKITSCPDVASAILGKKGVTIKTDKQMVGGEHKKATWNCDENGVCRDKKNGRTALLNALMPSGLLSNHGDGIPANLKKMEQDGTLGYCLNRNLLPGGDYFIQYSRNGGLNNVSLNPNGGIKIINSNKAYHNNPNVQQDSGQVQYITVDITKKK